MWTTPTAEQQPTAAPRPAGGLSIRLVFNAIRRHPLALFVVVVLALSAAAGVWLFLPLPKKTAAVVYRIGPQQSILGRTEGGHMDYAAYRKSQESIVKLRRTLNTVLNDPKVRELLMIREIPADEQLAWLERNITVDARGGPEYLRITVEGDNDRELLVLVGAVAKAYQDAAGELETGARKGRLEEIRKQQAETKRDLKKYDDAKTEIAVVLGATDAPTLALFESVRQKKLLDALGEHSTLQDRLKRAQWDLDEANRGRRLVATGAATGAVWFATQPREPIEIPETLIKQELAGNRGLQELERAAEDARDGLKLFDETLKPTPPGLIAAREKLKEAEEKRDKYLVEARAAIESRYETLVRDKRKQAETARIADAQSTYDQIKFDVDQAWKRIEDTQALMAKHGRYRMELDTLNKDIAQKEAVSAELAMLIERLQIESHAPSRVTPVEEPFLVTGLDGNRRLKFALMAALGAFGLGFAGVVFWEYRGRRVMHTDEVSSGLGARLLGVIPPLVGTGRATPGTQSNLIEAIDTTRIMITHGSPTATDLRVLLVTSAVSGEGKTTLSGNLAISLTRAGFRTLLIDGDTCAPTAHVLFGLAGTPGLGELLREEADLGDAIRSTPIPGLSVLPAGQWTQATHQMLVGDRWRRLKRDLKSRFDFVVIDTSPLLLVSDTMLLAREADGVVVSVLLGLSQIARVAETVTKLEAVGAKLAGVVVNNVRGAAAQHADAYRSKYYAVPGEPALLPDTAPARADNPPKEG